MERLKFPGRLSDISQTTWKHCCSQPPAASTDSLMLHHPRFPETRSYIGPILHKGASPFSHLPREIYDPIVRSISRKDDLLSSPSASVLAYSDTSASGSSTTTSVSVELPD
ncbi:hypothetical protein CC2G_013378 [Coprinopsis cinerea AmutBmut pab1-1]|nr:hypothetical protein CC2G_013378 [Coprinopsis cinerea AmutBmut pab1-1]